MGRQKTKKEWLKWFIKYESNNFLWSEYYETVDFRSNTKTPLKNARNEFRKKYKKYKSLGESIIISMTGKKATGRPKKEKPLVLDDWSREELEEVARRYHEITKDKKKSEKDKEASSLNLSKIKISKICAISRSGLYYSKKVKTKRCVTTEKIIIEAFHKYRGIFGRDRISALTGINYRRVGRYMKALNLTCKIRKSKRKSEIKNTNVHFKDLVQREYNAINVIATDVSYIRTNNGFAYLSIAIDHFSKKILSWNFKKENTNDLVHEHFRDMNLKNKIIHSDHGYQYSSPVFVEMSEDMGFKISMSRIGNSLDNREAEYFFSNIKSEKLSLLPKNNSFEQTKIYISEYINWYNNERPQKVLKWKTPEQVARMSI